MTEIVPTILTDTLENFSQFFSVYKTFAKRIQIDITDGEFAPTKTIGLAELPDLSDWDGKIDIHVMASKPSVFLPVIIKIHPSLCIFHAECNENLLPIFEQLASAGIKTGVALLKSTFPGNIKPYITAADHALIFAGALGKQGAEADLLQLEKVPLIREIDNNIEIGWDGGVTIENIRAIAHAKIDVINVGSALSRSTSPSEAFNALSAEIEKQGVNF